MMAFFYTSLPESIFTKIAVYFFINIIIMIIIIVIIVITYNILSHRISFVTTTYLLVLLRVPYLLRTNKYLPIKRH